MIVITIIILSSFFTHLGRVHQICMPEFLIYRWTDNGMEQHLLLGQSPRYCRRISRAERNKLASSVIEPFLSIIVCNWLNYEFRFHPPFTYVREPYQLSGPLHSLRLFTIVQ